MWGPHVSLSLFSPSRALSHFIRRQCGSHSSAGAEQRARPHSGSREGGEAVQHSRSSRVTVGDVGLSEKEREDGGEEGEDRENIGGPDM